MDQNRPTASRTAPPRRMTREQGAARRRRRRLRILRNWALLLSGCAGAMALMTSGILWLLPKAHAMIAGPEVFQARQYDGSGFTAQLSDQRLTLVNANLPYEAEPAPQLAVADDATGQQLEAEAAAAYREMAAAALADGVSLRLVSGYQDAAARQAALDRCRQFYLDKGRTQAEAEALAATLVPAADCNESGTGYAAEILSLEYENADAGFAEDRAFSWLSAYGAEFGFILRWPQDRQAATGMAYQPWHWRYVGRENALAIRASGLSLEEFLALEQTRRTED